MAVILFAIILLTFSHHSYGKVLVFNAPFNDTTSWVMGYTSSFPNNGPTNTQFNKLEWLRRVGPLPFDIFLANKLPCYRVGSNETWVADLVTTEYSKNNFKIKTNDELSATVTVYGGETQMGAWPAIYTWDGSGANTGMGEVDIFEYHAENPRLLELTNHVSGNGKNLDGLVTSGLPFTIKVVFGNQVSGGVRWFVNDNNVYTDTAGVPDTWSANIVVSLSISKGMWGHPPPSPTTKELYFRVQNLQVYR